MLAYRLFEAQTTSSQPYCGGRRKEGAHRVSCLSVLKLAGNQLQIDHLPEAKKDLITIALKAFRINLPAGRYLLEQGSDKGCIANDCHSRKSERKLMTVRFLGFEKSSIACLTATCLRPASGRSLNRDLPDNGLASSGLIGRYPSIYRIPSTAKIAGLDFFLSIITRETS